MKNKVDLFKTLRVVLSLLLVGCYVAGLVAMIGFSFSIGVMLWVISTVGGIGLLYCIRTFERRAAEVAEAEANKLAREAEEGAEDDSCE